MFHSHQVIAQPVSAGQIVITETDVDSDAVDRQTYNLTVNIGAAVANRLVVCTIGTATNNAEPGITSVDLGGAAATQNALSIHRPSGDGVLSAVYSRVITTGTSAALDVTFTTTCRHIVVHTFTLVPSTATAFDQSTDTDNNIDFVIDNEAGGALVGCTHAQVGGTIVATGPGFVEVSGGNVPIDGSWNSTAASGAYAAAGTGREVGFNDGGSPSRMSGACASFSPA